MWEDLFNGFHSVNLPNQTKQVGADQSRGQGKGQPVSVPIQRPASIQQLVKRPTVGTTESSRSVLGGGGGLV